MSVVFIKKCVMIFKQQCHRIPEIWMREKHTQDSTFYVRLRSRYVTHSISKWCQDVPKGHSRLSLVQWGGHSMEMFQEAPQEAKPQYQKHPVFQVVWWTKDRHQATPEEEVIQSPSRPALITKYWLRTSDTVRPAGGLNSKLWSPAPSLKILIP